MAGAPTPTIDELIAGLNSKDELIRAKAASRAITYSQHNQTDKAQITPHLTKALSDPNPRVRVFAVQSIWRLEVYDEDAVEILILWVNEGGVQDDEDNRTLQQAITALGVFADHAQEATPGLIRLLMNSDYHTRVAAADTLSSIGDPIAIPYAVAVVSSSGETWVRAEVAMTLTKYGPEARCTIPYLIPLLTEPDDVLRANVASAIRVHLSEGEYPTVNRIKDWWQETGQYQSWPACPNGLNGEVILPP